MTGGEDRRQFSTANEKTLRRLQLEWELRCDLGNTLRRTAGLPDVENPFDDGSHDAPCPRVFIFVEHMMQAVRKHPREYNAELEPIRDELRRLRHRIKRLDGDIWESVCTVAFGLDPEAKKLTRWLMTTPRDETEIENYMAEHGDAPIGVHALLSNMERAVAAIDEVLGQANIRKEQFASGKADVAAREVALLLAVFLFKQTGKRPFFRNSDVRVGPYAKALREIYDIVGVKHDIRRPAEWALKKLDDEVSHYP